MSITARLMSAIRLSAITAALNCALPTKAAPDVADLGPAPTTADYYRVRDGYIAAREKRCADVMALLPPAIHSPTFAGFPQRVRRGALEHTAKCAQRTLGWAEALPYLIQVVEIPHKDNGFWLRQLVKAAAAEYKPEISVDAVRRLADLDP